MASLAPLLRHAEQQIPEAAWPRARLMVLATAGLRMIPTTQSDEILDVRDDDDSPHPHTSFFFVNSKTLMGCTDPLVRGLAHSISVLLVR